MWELAECDQATLQRQMQSSSISESKLSDCEVELVQVYLETGTALEGLTRAERREADAQDAVLRRINEVWYQAGADGVISQEEGKHLCEVVPQHLVQVEEGLEVVQRLALRSFEVNFTRLYLMLSKAEVACLPGGPGIK